MEIMLAILGLIGLILVLMFVGVWSSTRKMQVHLSEINRGQTVELHTLEQILFQLGGEFDSDWQGDGTDYARRQRIAEWRDPRETGTTD